MPENCPQEAQGNRPKKQIRSSRKAEASRDYAESEVHGSMDPATDYCYAMQGASHCARGLTHSVIDGCFGVIYLAYFN